MAKGFDFTLDAAKAKPSQPLSPAMDAESVQQQWQAQFAELEDPRGRQGVEHPFLSIVMIAILATIGGATGWEDIEIYAESHRDWLGTLFSLPKGAPRLIEYPGNCSLKKEDSETEMTLPSHCVSCDSNESISVALWLQLE